MVAWMCMLLVFRRGNIFLLYKDMLLELRMWASASDTVGYCRDISQRIVSSGA